MSALQRNGWVICGLLLAVGCKSKSAEPQQANESTDRSGAAILAAASAALSAVAAEPSLKPEGKAQGALVLSSVGGIELIQHPVKSGSAPEGPVGGTVTAKLKSEHLESALLTLNGVAMKHDNYGSYKLPLPAVVPGAVPGAKLKLEASSGDAKVALEVACPEEVTIVAPADESLHAEGEKVTFKWTGKVDYQNTTASGAPTVNLYSYDEASGTLLGFGFNTLPKLERSATSIELTLPPTDKPSWLFELTVPGVETATGKYDGVHCTLRRRVILKKK
jgi:hypothetical protein